MPLSPRAQGQVAASKRRKIARATADTKAKLELADPTLVATAFKKERFHLFTRREPPAEDLDNPLVSRDVFNEKPIESGAVPGLVDEISGALLPRGAVMHTNRGDVWIKLVSSGAGGSWGGGRAGRSGGYWTNNR